jgi:pyridoxamine 5'-phosphate oxidase
MTTLALWRSVLAKALHQNRALAYARYFQLASIREDGHPANRTVVFRGFLPDSNQLMMISDRRSQKVPQIQQTPGAEICWYFPKTREQLRLSGLLSIVDQSDPNSQRQQAYLQTWQNLSDSARAQFYWPPPGQPSDPSVVIPEPSDRSDKPAENFLLILFEPTEVDHLDLRSHPHHRHRYWCDSEQRWQIEAVNP